MRAEALIQLQKIGKAAIVEYTTNGICPPAAAPVTPATSCCQQNAGGKRKCAASASDWSAPAWL